MAKKLLAKAGLIQLPPMQPRLAAADTPAGEAAGRTGVTGVVATTEQEQARAKTAPGSMLQFMTAQSAAVKEAEILRERLAGYDGALPARRLDPRTVRASPWANRHADSYTDQDFAALKLDIAAAGGNVQAIKVRPVAASGQGVGPSNGQSSSLVADPAKPVPCYEIVFGHRRHQACLALGLPVLAVVQDLPEQQLFVEMERENRARKDLSAWEQGMMYARALDQGLYPSNRQLAAAIGRDLGDVGKALSLARLPLAVVQAFRSPLDLQYRWAKPLGDAQQRDPDGLVQRARALKPQADQRTPRQTFEALVADGDLALGSPPPAVVQAEITVRLGARPAAVVAVDAQGRTVVRFNKPLTDTRRRALADLLAQFLAG